jgi:hypothetical protein
MRTTGAHNCMGMATRLAGRDYGVHARVDGWLGTGQAPKRVRRGNKEEPHGENTSKEDHREVELDEKRERERRRERNQPVDVGNQGST